MGLKSRKYINKMVNKKKLIGKQFFLFFFPRPRSSKWPIDQLRANRGRNDDSGPGRKSRRDNAAAAGDPAHSSPPPRAPLPRATRRTTRTHDYGAAGNRRRRQQVTTGNNGDRRRAVTAARAVWVRLMNVSRLSWPLVASFSHTFSPQSPVFPVFTVNLENKIKSSE